MNIQGFSNIHKISHFNLNDYKTQTMVNNDKNTEYITIQNKNNKNK
tara:strand:+ start:1004 stop:1141 length:138 start_codon:yes stop_codon:yes gene_type:complete